MSTSRSNRTPDYPADVIDAKIFRESFPPGCFIHRIIWKNAKRLRQANRWDGRFDDAH